jgi:flagellar basal-body rod protein FlgC
MSKGLFDSIRISATGLRGQRVKMDVVARNLANAETTRTEDGTPYRRERAIFEEVLERRLSRVRNRYTDPRGGAAPRLARTHVGHMAGLRPLDTEAEAGVRTEVGRSPDASDFRVVYDPGHPDADAEGYLLLPNINVITEMADMIAASRAYEANVSAVQAAKDMFNDALKI